MESISSKSYLKESFEQVIKAYKSAGKWPQTGAGLGDLCSPAVAHQAAGEEWLVAQAGEEGGRQLFRSCFM